jgi:hypothetical protein
MTETSFSESDCKITPNEHIVVKREDKDERVSNFLFGSLIVVTMIGTALIVHFLHDFRRDLKEKNPSYNFPEYTDLCYSLISTIVLIVKIKIKILVCENCNREGYFAFFRGSPSKEIPEHR